MNDQCEKEPVTAPDRAEIARQFGTARKFFGSDAIAAYRQVLLDEKSRPMTAVWVPQGLIQSLRLCFGMKNAGTVLGRKITAVLEELPEEYQEACQGSA